ncbi:tetratricopeptide repeat protein [Mameliella alba]|nr:tetratricopeptide repeat protein [Mameliella sediminis]MBY6116216.1 tetratricopeptide repeat protein [Antarctobacter heliothermus]MBY6146181.1 tetratricopeptide repeat protein [Mameliella alba]MBY6161838.1 tetratricopeptide repeat protein [Mameliella alba]MBY6170308.1 tetratricopeptide repeat protein [Mameliella alba]
MISLPVAGRAENRVADLLAELREAETETAALRLENQIVAEWSKSGSASMDLLLKRGRDALEVQNFTAAVEHFRALTDHAPEFAEGWHGLALAYFGAERFGPAMDALERVLALNPDHFPALRGVGAINERVGNPTLAYRAFEKVLELRPHDPDVQQAMDRLEREAIGITL